MSGSGYPSVTLHPEMEQSQEEGRRLHRDIQKICDVGIPKRGGPEWPQIIKDLRELFAEYLLWDFNHRLTFTEERFIAQFTHEDLFWLNDQGIMQLHADSQNAYHNARRAAGKPVGLEDLNLPKEMPGEERIAMLAEYAKNPREIPLSIYQSGVDSEYRTGGFTGPISYRFLCTPIMCMNDECQRRTIISHKKPLGWKSRLGWMFYAFEKDGPIDRAIIQGTLVRKDQNEPHHQCFSREDFEARTSEAEEFLRYYG